MGPPSAVADLGVTSVTDSSVTLGWSAPANEDASVRGVDYEVRSRRDTLTAGGWNSALEVARFRTTVATGRQITLPLRGFEPGTQYAFALRTTDEAGNVSGISNIATATTSLGGPLANHAGPGIAPSRRPSGRQTELYWRGAGGGVPQEIRIYDVVGRRIRRIPLPSDPEGVTTWDGRDDDNALVPAGVYFARLTSGSVGVQTRVVLLP